MRAILSIPPLTAAILAVACESTSTEPSSELGEVRAAAPMSVARAVHTATTLRNGKVLVVGGLDGAARSAELFDPSKGRFTSAASPLAGRWSHTATLLHDGTVLIVGGFNGSYLSSSELFDPITETFTAGPSLRGARFGHVAVLMKDGRVLIAGGEGPGREFLASAEVFDPSTNTFTPTAAMSVARESHAAVLLENGDVLVVGGHSRSSALVLHSSAERYDPVRGVFTAAGAMTRPRHKHAAVAIPGNLVLVTGGSDERDDRGLYRDAEIFDAAENRFKPIGQMRRARYKHEGTMLALGDGSVLVAGGAAEAELFDVQRRTFISVRTGPSLAGSFSAVSRLQDGSVLITGGYGNGAGPRSHAWLYVPSAPTGTSLTRVNG